jgi:hypothetical protein
MSEYRVNPMIAKVSDADGGVLPYFNGGDELEDGNDTRSF